MIIPAPGGAAAGVVPTSQPMGPLPVIPGTPQHAAIPMIPGQQGAHPMLPGGQPIGVNPQARVSFGCQFFSRSIQPQGVMGDMAPQGEVSRQEVC